MKDKSRFKGDFFLADFLDVDLERDRLCRIGPVTAAEQDEGDIVFTAPRLVQKSLPEDARFFSDDGEHGTVSIRVRLYDNGCLRLQMSPAPKPFSDDTPMMQLDDDVRALPAVVEQRDGEWLISDRNGVRLRIGPGPFAPRLKPDRSVDVEFMDRDYFFTQYWDALPLFWLEREDGPVTVGMALRIDENEHFCGTGERFDRIDLFGRSIDLINENGHGVNSRRTYKNIPLLLSSRPYGLFVHSSAKMRLDIGRHSSRSLQWLIEDDVLDAFFIGGASFGEILHSYRQMTGFPQMPPLWSYGAWMSRCTYESDRQVTAIANRLRDEEYPMDILHLDTGWFATEWKCDWTFSKERFPDPEDFFRRMREMGFRISLWEYPYVSPDVAISKIAREKEYVGVSRNPDCAVEWGDTLDFSNPNAVSWYQGMLKRLLEMGAATFKTDFGENIDDSAIYQNITAAKYRNLFSLLYQKATWEIIEKTSGEPFNWARAGWAGSQRYPVHWSADCSSTWDGVAQSLWGGLHLGLSGFAFWSHDIGGFYTIEDFIKRKPDPDLFVRWTQHGVFSSHMRFHGMTPREPWEYPSVAAILRQWLRFRYALLPYLISESKKCCVNGLPVLRALVFDWSHDPAVWSVSDQYLFGDSFLVCPVFNEKGVRDVYLPEGEWVDFWSGERFAGPKRLAGVSSPLQRMPIYLRGDAVIPFAEPVACTDRLSRAERCEIRYDDGYRGFEHSPLSKWLEL